MQFDASIGDYKTILKEELAARCRQNPRYSLRAFARDLKLAPSRLSEILSGKQGLSRMAAEKVAKALGYAPSECERFCDLVESVHARSRKDREAAKLRLRKHQIPTAEYLLQLDAFKAIADWHHFAILELTKLADFNADSRWIGRRLGVSEFEVQLALDRLARLGLITRKGTKIKLSHGASHVPEDISSDSIKKFHAQILMKAKEALFVQPLAECEFRSRIVAIDRSRLAEAKKALRAFEHEFCSNIQGSPSLPASDVSVKDGLYCLAMQFFDLSDRTRSES